MGRLAVTLSALAVTLIVASSSGASREGMLQPAASARPLLGITGEAPRFQDQTGQRSTVVQAFLGWGQGAAWGKRFANLLPLFGPIPMLHLGTGGPGTRRETISPGAIASGKGDSYLVALNQAIAAWGKAIYVRPMAEMNNPSTNYAGYNANGTPRDPAHSPAAYRKAFARIYVILHGGPAGMLNARLRALGLPPVAGGGELAENPFPQLRVVWSPLAGGTPRVAGNAPEMYYPGRRYVDVEGGDIYDESLTDNAPWSALEELHALARSHRKPFSVPEWGLYGIDDPTFVKHMCAFLRAHPATEVQVFYESKPGSTFDMAPKPKSRVAYRQCLTSLAGPLPGWASGNA